MVNIEKHKYTWVTPYKVEYIKILYVSLKLFSTK